MAKLKAAQRNKLPASSFAGPDRSYPINDESHARNALARASQHASPALQASIKRKVKARYPNIQVKAAGGAVRFLAEGGAAKARADRPDRRKGGMCG